MLEVLYRDARARVVTLARSLTDEQLALPIAATPDWNAREVVAHLTGVAADIKTGNFAGAPGRRWTSAQVQARVGHTIDQLADEWDQLGPVVEGGLAAGTHPPNTLYDILTHEADLREQHGLGTPPQADVDAIVFTVAEQVLEGYQGPGTVVLRSAGHEATGGTGTPTLAVTLDPYELFRGLFSRRSRSQMRAWDWEGDGDPAAAVEHLTIFGARDDDQPLPR